MDSHILVTGGAGFIGHHLCRFLRKRGYKVRAVDKNKPKFSGMNDFDEFLQLDLQEYNNCLRATEGIDKVYALAAENGSIAYTTSNKADLVRENCLININTAKACVKNKVKRLYFSSSACVYPINLQATDEVHYLREEDAYPSFPDSEYGWEKLFSERLYKSFEQDHGLEVRIGRYFNIYGAECHIDTIRAKAPMALTRKVVEAGNGGDVFIWGDGRQLRSFLYIDDCVEATYKMMESNITVPVNLGTLEELTINELVDLICEIEGIRVNKINQPAETQGVRTRMPALERAKKLLRWENKVTLREGMKEVNKYVHKVLGI